MTKAIAEGVGAVILSNADVLVEDETLKPHVLKRLDEITKATERAADLTRSLLPFQF